MSGLQGPPQPPSMQASLAALLDAAKRAIPFLQDEANKYDDDGSNEPLETLRDLQSATLILRTISGGWEVVPGVMHCAKCAFRLVRTNLHVVDGTFSAGDNKTEPCPNGCGPLWPVTWEQEARECWQRMEEMAHTAPATRALPDGWMPIETAPKSVADGSRVAGVYLLGFIFDADLDFDPQACIDVVWWEPLLPNRAGGRGKWCRSCGAETIEVKPTHWMPLPAAPLLAAAMEVGRG